MIAMNQVDRQSIHNVVFAEDDEDFFYFFKAALISLCKSIKVWRTENGVMLLSLIQTSIKPDIIFLDLNMPLKNGLECLEEIKSRKQYEGTKVIMCSSAADKEQIDKCYDRGADYFFIKPNSTKRLVSLFKNLFNDSCFHENVRPPRESFVLS